MGGTMSIEIDGLREEIAKAFEGKSQRFRLASQIIKLVTLAASCIAVAAQFATVPAGQPWPAANIIGIAAAFLIGIGSGISLIVEPDTSTELEKARRALAIADAAQREADEIRIALDDFDAYELEQKRSNALYQAMSLMRGVIESALALAKIDLTKTIETLIDAARRELPIALGYQMSEHYTLCVYVAESFEGKTHLRCIAHIRTVMCALAEARTWPAGVGAVGAAYSRQREVVLPDLTIPEVASLYGHMSKDSDVRRYKSAAAVPIRLNPHDDPWGVVVGTSDRVRHFHIDRDETGLQTVEAVRALAGMVALAVRAAQARPTAAPT